MSQRYRHEVCFSGPEDMDALIEAAEQAGFKFEFGSSTPERDFIGQAVERDEAQHELASLRGRLADRRGEPSD